MISVFRHNPSTPTLSFVTISRAGLSYRFTWPYNAQTAEGKEHLAELRFRNETARLPEDRLKRTAIDFFVIWDSCETT